MPTKQLVTTNYMMMSSPDPSQNSRAAQAARKRRRTKADMKRHRRTRQAAKNRTPGSPPPASSVDALRRMKSQRQQDTKPEVLLRSALHRMGYRYRINIAPLSGMRSRADVVVPRIKVAVFVDGCFWHSCPRHGTMPKHNTKWWRIKLASNVARDRAVDKRLHADGWKVIRVWEHENPGEAAHRVAEVFEQRYSVEELRG